MRLRVLALPKRTLGTAVEQPYLLVFDRCTSTQMDYLGDVDWETWKTTVGAQGIVVFPEEVDLDERQMSEIDDTVVNALRVALAGF